MENTINNVHTIGLPRCMYFPELIYDDHDFDHMIYDGGEYQPDSGISRCRYIN